MSIFAKLATDRTIRGPTIKVYVIVCNHLVYDESRTLKHSYVARLLGWQRANVSREIRALVRSGYLSEGARDGRYKTYRLAPGPT